MWDKIKGAIFEADGTTPAAAPAAPNTSALGAPQPTVAAPALVATTDNKFVEALRGAIKNRSTAFTQLLTNADKMSVIPDTTMRLKAAFQMLEGRGLKEILGAIEVHAADLESQRMAFTRQAEDAAKQAISAKQIELDSIDPSIQSAQAQIEALTKQIGTLNDSIAQKSARKAELTAEIATENQRFASAKTQFETALTIVKSELDGQKAIIQSALS